MNKKEELREVILSYAFEGGITYWCDHVCAKGEIKQEDEDLYMSDLGAKGYTLLLSDAEEDAVYKLKPGDLDNAIKWYFSERDLEDIESCMNRVDDVVADEIVQHAVFGEVVYG